MAAWHNLPQLANSAKSSISKRGVLTIHGFGVRVRVRCGHLEIDDGVGMERRTLQLPRVGHGMKRLVCISEDGFITLSALRWLSDIDASFLMLDRMGKVLFVTGPTAPSDSRLHHAQSLAFGNGSALVISRELISAKLLGQENLVRDQLKNPTTADVITQFRASLARVESLEAVRLLEGQAAAAYWNAFRDVSILWPKSHLRRVPAHWRTFGTRGSPLTGGPRLAVNPPNAILNYCFALLASEARLGLVVLGLDPGIGFLHPPRANRDSLALDVMEAVRPDLERWLFRWLSTEPLRRTDFYETGTGNCRLTSRLCSQLSETAPTWGKLVAPWAEYVANTLWATTSRPKTGGWISTRLTQRNRREAKGGPSFPSHEPVPRPQAVCRLCGTAIEPGRKYCALCVPTVSKENLVKVARTGRIAAQSPQAQVRRADSQRRHEAAKRGWLASSLPAWLNNEVYDQKIQPRLAGITYPAIASALGVSLPYAADIRAGRRRPHPRHWAALAQLVRVSANGSK